MEITDKTFWKNRWQQNETGWDIGEPSTPIRAYIDQMEDKDQRILIPGCGNAYEAEYLIKKGFKNTFVIDITEDAIASFKNRFPDFPEENIFIGDFFELESTFDLIFEQTFFCAINPSLRSAYAKKMHELLSTNGKLVGLLFDAPLNSDHPPFGGSREEYIPYFDQYFEFEHFETAQNSIKPRAGRELFIELRKK